MCKCNFYPSTPVEYRKTDLGWCVTIFGKHLGTVCLSAAIFPHQEDLQPSVFVFHPFGASGLYYGDSMDMAVLNYLAHQYGGGLDA